MSYYDEIDLACIEGRRRTLLARCIQCGYEIFDGDDAKIVQSNGCAIHKDCWEEYASENADEFLKDF